MHIRMYRDLPPWKCRASLRRTPTLCALISVNVRNGPRLQLSAKNVHNCAPGVVRPTAVARRAEMSRPLSRETSSRHTSRLAFLRCMRNSNREAPQGAPRIAFRHVCRGAFLSLFSSSPFLSSWSSSGSLSLVHFALISAQRLQSRDRRTVRSFRCLFSLADGFPCVFCVACGYHLPVKTTRGDYHHVRYSVAS